MAEQPNHDSIQPSPPRARAARPRDVPERLEVEYRLILDDAAAFFRYHAAHTPKPKRTLSNWAWVLIWLLWSFAIALGISTHGLRGAFSWVDALVLISLTTTFVIYLFGHRIAAGLYKRNLRRNPKVFGRRRVVITPEVIKSTLELSTTTTLWEGVERVGLTDDHAFFYTGKAEAVVLPRRAFADEGEFDTFVETARRFRDAALAP